MICDLKQQVALQRNSSCHDELNTRIVYGKLEGTRDFACYGEDVRRKKAKNLAIKHCLMESYLSLDSVAIKRTIMELSDNEAVNGSNSGDGIGGGIGGSGSGSMDEDHGHSHHHGSSDGANHGISGAFTSHSVDSSGVDRRMSVNVRMNFGPVNGDGVDSGDGVQVHNESDDNCNGVASEEVDDRAKREQDFKQMEQECNEVIITERMKNLMKNGTDNNASKQEELMKVKLVVTEIHRTTQDKLLRRVLSPVMSTIQLSPQFGFFHTALIVGPWYLEWTNSSLIVPRRCTSTAALFAADVGREFSGIEVHKAADIIADKVIEWNTKYEYSQNHKNCQHFVDEVCEALGIELNFGGALQNYIKQCRTFGTCEIKYIIPDEVRTALDLKDKEIEFKTHAQLDDFVRSVAGKLPDFFPANPDDWMLLKSFDRAFWLRVFRFPTKVEYAPHECHHETYSTSCPFGHPRATNSIVN